MKHISKTIILVLSAAAVTVSCQEKELSAGIGQEGIGEYRTFRATTADESDEPSTRTYLGGSSADKSRPVYWNKSDAIFVTDGKTGSEFRVVSESGSTDAIIEGEIPSSDRYSAVYPYRIVKSLRSDGSFDVDFPDWQLCSQDGIYSEYYPMLASCEEGVLRFRNVFGIFVLQLTGDDDDVLNITFEGKNKDGEDLILAGEACIGNPSEPVYEWGSDTQKVVTLDCWHSGKERLSSEPSSFHIVLPPQEYASFTVTVNMVDGRKMTTHSSKPLTIHRSGYTVASPLHFKADAPEAEYPANCYVVKPGGSVIFPAVKGNTTESVGPVSSVSVLWESFGTDIKPAVNDVVQNVTLSGTDSNRKIAVTAGKKEGNAVIAAKDVSGNILWSWHIWVTSADLDALAQVYNNGAGTMMDRNLGATSATPGDVGALGLLYQWGRKDPFLGGPSITSSNRATSTITWPSAVESNSSNGTIAYATSHPTTFITTNKYNGDWYYTGSSSTDDMRWNSNKGVYDPCPSGYRVPTGGNNGVWAKALYYLYDIANGPINWACKGMDFSNYFIPNTLCWYPFSGYIYNGKYSSFVGMYGSYWSCTPLDNNAYYLSITEKYTVSAAETDRREIGMSVRCIKEGSMSPDINVSSVSLNKSSLTLTEGYTETLTATVSPSDATNKNVSWKSSNTSVATVSSSGKVSAIKAGSATITVTTEDGGYTATCKIEVNDSVTGYIDFSDSCFEAYCLAEFDSNKDKRISVEEAQAVTVINLCLDDYFPSKGVKNFQDFKFFKALKKVILTGRTNFYFHLLDLSHNVDLEYLECHYLSSDNSRYFPVNLCKNDNLSTLNWTNGDVTFIIKEGQTIPTFIYSYSNYSYSSLDMAIQNNRVFYDTAGGGAIEPIDWGGEID